MATAPLLERGDGHAKSVRLGGPRRRAYPLGEGPLAGSSPGRSAVHRAAAAGPTATPSGDALPVWGSRVLAVALVLGVLVTGRLSAPGASAAPPAATPELALWGWPLDGGPVVSRSFGQPPTPYAAGHRGVDLLGAAGSAVLAAGAGVVVFAGMVAGRPVVSVDHAGGLRTTYEPVTPTVAAGQAVARGSPLGLLVPGHAGCPAEACLHWGLRRGDTYLDPLTLLRPPRVRLLPWG